ncbi:MAG: hypothetical protein ACOY4I_01395 [Bacillota bacterium]
MFLEIIVVVTTYMVTPKEYPLRKTPGCVFDNIKLIHPSIRTIVFDITKVIQLGQLKTDPLPNLPCILKKNKLQGRERE